MINVFDLANAPIYNLDFIKPGSQFPPQSKYMQDLKFQSYESMYNGTYGRNRYIVLKDNNGHTKKLPYKILSLNRFKTYTNRIVGLMSKDDFIIKTKDREMQDEIIKLVERTKWVKGIRKAFKEVEKYGNVVIKTYRHGVSATSPINAIVVRDKSDRDKVTNVVLYEFLRNMKNEVWAVRIEIHGVGWIKEYVYKYSSSNILGKSITYKYKDRVISKKGNYYETGINKLLASWLQIDGDTYGISPYEDFKDVVFAIERRQALSDKILDCHSEPILAVGPTALKENYETGEVEALDVYGSVIPVTSGEQVPQYITWDGKLDSSENMIALMTSELYELTELGKTFMTGEYDGNISEETLQSLVDSAISKADRHIYDMYYEIKDSLYVLCHLNGIDVDYDDLNLTIPVGVVSKDKEKADILNSRVEKGTISVTTGLVEYYGYSEEQALKEYEKIKSEQSVNPAASE